MVLSYSDQKYQRSLSEPGPDRLQGTHFPKLTLYPDTAKRERSFPLSVISHFYRVSPDGSARVTRA